MEVAASVVGSVLTCALNQLGVICLSDQIQTLRDKKGELIARVNEVNEILQIAEVQQGKTRTSEAQNWLSDANNVINKADDVGKEANVGRRCLSGVLPNCCSPNCRSRLKLREQISEFIKEMVDLLDKASRFSEESLTFLGMEMPTTGLIGSTADENLKMVWECIVGDKFEKIGVYGMGGVGKTTIMKTISNQLVQERIRFENVLWVTVSKAVDAHTLQKQIAKVLGLDLSDEQDEDSRSSSLLRALHRKGKFVLILDDIWKPFNLHELGVPEPTKDNGCKIILTTRSREVCEGMLCQKYVKVEQLSEDEAWELFFINVREELVPDVEEIAKEVVAECCGLPLAIITVGRAMRSKDVGEWRVALSDLKKSTSLNMDIEEHVIQRLKFSYDRLREENHQKCFLYCALYPEDFEIKTSELIGYWVMEGLVKGSSKEEEMLRGHVILNTLKRCCMLEEVSSKGRGYKDDRDLVKMHDLIRDMAHYITKTKPKFMVRTGLSSTEVPHEDDWSEDLERVSFMHSRIEDISIIPKCPKLLTFILYKSYYSFFNWSEDISGSFFMHMKSLTVLDLSWTQIEWLPDSVSDLVNLHGLLLLYCQKLVRVPSLSRLRSLRVLKLTRSAIEELPRGMEMLVNLRSLDLSYNYILKEMIPTGLISKFSLLQELTLPDMENLSSSTQLENLSSLTQLENLHIVFHELSDLAYGEFGNFERLKKYYIQVEKMDRVYDYINHYIIRGGMESTDHERSLCLSNSKGIPCNALSLPKRIQFLWVKEFNQITRLSELPLNDSHQDLRELWIDSCNSIKILLSSRLLQQLLNLQVIQVVDCTLLEELIVEEEEEAGRINSNHSGTGIDYTVALPRLKSLIFHNLPKLKSIWKGVMVCDSLQTVVVCNCPELKRLPLFNREHQSAPPSLKEIYGKREWWDSLEWDYPCPEHLFQEFNY